MYCSMSQQIKSYGLKTFTSIPVIETNGRILIMSLDEWERHALLRLRHDTVMQETR